MRITKEPWTPARSRAYDNVNEDFKSAIRTLYNHDLMTGDEMDIFIDRTIDLQLRQQSIENALEIATKQLNK